MNGIQDPGLNQLLTRRLNITDGPAPAGTLAPEIMPVMLVVPPRREDDFIRGEFNVTTEVKVAPVALKYGILRLYNPAASGVIAVIKRIRWYSSTNTQEMKATILAGASVLPEDDMNFNPTIALDTRIRPQSGVNFATALGCEAGAMAVPPGLALFSFCHLYMNTSGPMQPVDIGAVLTPGYAIDFWNASVAQQFLINVWWRERKAQPSELG
jgi:hypothetical protein